MGTPFLFRACFREASPVTLDPVPKPTLTSIRAHAIFDLFVSPNRSSAHRLIYVIWFLISANLLATPQARPGASPPANIANFTDVAETAGPTAQNIFGGIDTKKYNLETTGNGVAIFDYDNDGWRDIFLVNGTRLEGWPSGLTERFPGLPVDQIHTLKEGPELRWKRVKRNGSPSLLN